MLGTAIESIGTKGGRSRLSASAKELEKIGVPSYAGKPLVYGATIGIGYFGGKGFKGQIEKGLGLPKMDTKIFGVQQEIKSFEGLQRIRTTALTETKVKGLFRTDKYLGTARAITETKVTPSGLFLGETATYGRVGLQGVKFPTGKIKVGRVKEFVSEQATISQPTTITEIYKKGGLDFSRQVEGFSQISVGKVGLVKLKKGARIISEDYFVGAGGGYDLKKSTFVFGKTLTGEKKIFGEYRGLIFKKEIPTDKFIIGGGRLQLKPTIQYPQESLKITSATQTAVSKIIPTIKTTPTIPFFKTQPTTKTELQPTIKSTPIIQETKVDLKQPEKIFVSTKQAPLEISTPRTRERMKLAFKTKQTPILKQTQMIKPTTKIKQIVTLAQPQISRQKQRQILKTRFETPSPMGIPYFMTGGKGFFIPPFTLKFPKQKPRTKPTQRIIRVRKTQYQPTLRAKAFGITATKIPRAYKIGAGGIISRPIIKVKKKKKKKKK